MDAWGWVSVTIGVVVTVALAPGMACRAHEAQPRSATAGQTERIIDESGAWQTGRVTMTNSSAWPMWDVMSPEMQGMDFTSVRPGELVSNVSADLVPVDELVTVQVTDARRKVWLWTPLSQVLSQIPPPITPLAKFVQLMGRHIERARDVRRRLN